LVHAAVRQLPGAAKDFVGAVWELVIAVDSAFVFTQRQMRFALLYAKSPKWFDYAKAALRSIAVFL
jgi:hypothetical protein